jgi:3-oxoacyl-[acyl-carrier protein] reductase
MLPHMRKAGGGSIVNVTSIKGRQPPPRVVTSGVAWAAAMNLSKALSLELAGDGIRVNVASVGGILTEQMGAGRAKWAADKTLEEFLAARVANIPLRRLGTVEETAQAIYFLAAPSSSYITGQCLAIDGGGLRSI